MLLQHLWKFLDSRIWVLSSCQVSRKSIQEFLSSGFGRAEMIPISPCHESVEDKKWTKFNGFAVNAFQLSHYLRKDNHSALRIISEEMSEVEDEVGHLSAILLSEFQQLCVFGHLCAGLGILQIQTNLFNLSSKALLTIILYPICFKIKA